MLQLTPRKKAFLTGTLLLTFTGLICRILGFFYRIYLSRTIGAEGLGLYQMVHPLFGICFALCAGSLQTALSQYVAARQSQGKKALMAALSVSLSLAHHFLSRSPGPVCSFRAPMRPISSCYRSVRSFLRPSRLY